MKIKQGISLIVLVITIIVMTILAGAIILTINNSGIIDRASSAVEESNLATVKELTQMAWAEAYAGEERTQEGLKEAVDKALEDNKVDTTKYIIEVTTSGVTVELKGSQKAKWVQQGLTVTNGTDTLEIGDSIAYDETNEGKETGLTETDWKVLGASDEGELLIMSTNSIAYKRLADPSKGFAQAQNDWLNPNGASILDGICEPYGKGEGAIGVRSVAIEDINKITGYDPVVAKYGEGETYEYGNEVKYSYNGTTKPAYSGSNGKTGTLSTTYSNGFYFYNGEEFVIINDLTTGTSGTTFATLKSDYYDYFIEDIGLLDIESKASLMLFGDINDSMGVSYWLDSPCVMTDASIPYFAMRYVESGFVGAFEFWGTTGSLMNSVSYEWGVRAVVTLSSDVELTGSSSDGWNIK